MNCERCLNRGDCERYDHDKEYFHVGQIVTLKGQLFRVKSVKPNELRLRLWRKTTNTVGGGSLMTHIKFCPKCKKQAAEYRFNKAGNLAFYVCVLCGYSAKDYAKDLKEKK